ncbi:hypothetical protein EVAR_66290_1 [Eumeta japonica]|uniref:Uncharacterized protein n=1 Tax=Eumeta variegata TaxID=151549 RepID=A0A4C1YUD2_EUMVA|nr:hypothetical protein EVAR_66290_1 [Eumeta japonica]
MVSRYRVANGSLWGTRYPPSVSSGLVSATEVLLEWNYICLGTRGNKMNKPLIKNQVDLEEENRCDAQQRTLVKSADKNKLIDLLSVKKKDDKIPGSGQGFLETVAKKGTRMTQEQSLDILGKFISDPWGLR